MMDIAQKARAFTALHRGPGAFIMPNPWDAGSARLLAGFGFQALGTSSAGCAFAAGRSDLTMSRDAVIAHLETIAGAVDLPVSADLQDGLGDTPAAVAATMERAIAAGVVGASIEDATGDMRAPLFEREAAVDRLAGAIAVARAAPFPITITARAENFLVGVDDLGDVIGRLQAYQEAGADVLYAPGVNRREDIASLVRNLDKPINVVMGLKGPPLRLEELSDLGVRRVSLGSTLARLAYGALLRAAEDMRSRGEFAFAEQAAPFAELNAMFSAARPAP